MSFWFVCVKGPENPVGLHVTEHTLYNFVRIKIDCCSLQFHSSHFYFGLWCISVLCWMTSSVCILVFTGDPYGLGLGWKVNPAGETADRTGESAQMDIM